MKLDKRRIQLILLKLKTFRVSKDSFRYLRNRVRKAFHNPQKQLLLPHPTGLMLELGNRCNLHCIICPREYIFGKQMDQGFMETDKVFQIVDEVYPYLDSIGLTGLGETFLYPHLLEVCQYIKQCRNDIIISVSTNAHFKGFLEKALPIISYIDSLQISVDGVGETYERIRPNTDFNFIAENIRQIVKAGSNTVFVINTVITIENYQHLLPIVEFAQSVGIKHVNFNYMNLASLPEKREEYDTFYRSQELFASMTEFKKKCSQYADVNVTIQHMDFHKFVHGCFQLCDALWHHHYITWDGYLVPCCAKPFPKEKQLGNVFHDGGVMKVLNGEKAMEMRRLWQQNITPSFCSTCNTICGDINLWHKTN